ncbi:FunK1 protein kinase [Nemania diffusa]|nr:FunK1 protein kinase [Nemania diffusa]
MDHSPAPAGGVNNRCTIPSAAPSPDSFLQWFSNYVRNIAPEHESTDDGARLLLTGWDHVQVIGQFYRCECTSFQDGLLHLCQSAHQVFASQPTRLFLHGFYIRGSLIKLGDVSNVQKDFRMTDQDLGNINIIQRDEDGSFIILNLMVMPSLGKVYLESQPISSHEDLVGTETMCLRSRMPDPTRWNYVLKVKRRRARDRLEDELLKLAKEQSVWGAVSLDYYEENENINGQEEDVTCNTKGIVKYTEETDACFLNYILACIVTSPVGRLLHTFQSLSELLLVFRDTIKCHRSLYYDAEILHQDISPGNMIILDGQEEGKPQGLLIDLDSAIKLAEGLEIDHDIIGTRPFMAIGVLKSEYHTYRHDLESFLYIFLWTIIPNHMDNPPKTSKLRQWCIGDWDEFTVRKSLDVDLSGFRMILEEFTPESHPLKPLAERLRQILFPLRTGVIWAGTDSSPEAVDKLCDGIIRAFEMPIASEGGR